MQIAITNAVKNKYQLLKQLMTLKIVICYEGECSFQLECLEPEIFGGGAQTLPSFIMPEHKIKSFNKELKIIHFSEVSFYRD